MSEFVGEVNDGTFETEVLTSDRPVLVDFWAQWCGPCRQLAPTVDKLAQEFDGRLKVVKMNVDDSPMTPSRYRVNSIPTLILFSEGNERDRIIGNQSKDAISQMLSRYVK